MDVPSCMPTRDMHAPCEPHPLMPSLPPSHQTRTCARHLVLAGGGLAGLELLEVPVANGHVAGMLVHALGEVLRGRLAVVAPFLLLLGLGLRLDGLLGRGLGGGAAAEETANGVADRGADGDTAMRQSQQLSRHDMCEKREVLQGPAAAASRGESSKVGRLGRTEAG